MSVIENTTLRERAIYWYAAISGVGKTKTLSESGAHELCDFLADVANALDPGDPVASAEDKS